MQEDAQSVCTTHVRGGGGGGGAKQNGVQCTAHDYCTLYIIHVHVHVCTVDMHVYCIHCTCMCTACV